MYQIRPIHRRYAERIELLIPCRPEPHRRPERDLPAGHDFLVLNHRPDLLTPCDQRDESTYGVDLP